MITESDIVVLSNNIYGNVIGVELGSDLANPRLLFKGNAIQNNSQYNATEMTDDYESRGSYDFDLSGNWWGTTDYTAIEAKLYHKTQDFNLGTITYTPFLISMPAAVPTLP